MEELKRMVIEFFMQTKKFYKRQELIKRFNIKGEKQTNIFNDALNELVMDGSLFFDKKNGFKYFSNDMDLAFGEIKLTNSGNGIVNTNNGYKISIDHTDLNGALDGDKVIVDSITVDKRKNFKGNINRIVKRKNGQVTFEVIGNGYSASLVPYDKRININIEISKDKQKKLINGEIIKVTVDCEPYDDNYYNAEEVESIGFVTDPDIDIKILATKYDIKIDFPEEVLREANKLPFEVNEEDIKDRVDLRDKKIVTIDCDNTKDRDDAVYVEKLEDGNYKLIVSISAVNHYIKPNSKLYAEAMRRGTSHYPNNTCIPMFPKNISNGICSINQNVDRLAKSCEMIIDPNGQVIDYNVYNSVINSKKAMKYSEVNRVLKGEIVFGYEKFIEDLKIMKELSDVLENARNKRNYINFDIPDIEVVRDDKNNYQFNESGIGIAEEIIENFMLITNTTIAECYSWLPFIYRIHETPNEETVKSMIRLLNTSTYNIPKIGTINEMTIKRILDKTKDSDIAHIIKTYLLKAMKCAKYDTNNVGHFALQLNKYCHFTSPIRRISDFMLHTLIDELDNFDYTDNSFKLLENRLKSICEIASNTERIDKNFEYEAKNMAMAEYMQEHIGEEYEAYITEVYQYGMSIVTSEHISGKIKLDDILGDKYYFDSNKHLIIGKNNNNKFRIGDKISVVAKNANKESRTINFKIEKEKILRKS